MLKKNVILAISLLVATGTLIYVSTSITAGNATVLSILITVTWMACGGVVSWTMTTSREAPNVSAVGDIQEDKKGIHHGYWSGRISGHRFSVYARSAGDLGKPGYVTLYFEYCRTFMGLSGWPQQLFVHPNCPSEVIEELGSPQTADNFFDLLVDLGVNPDNLRYAWPKSD